MADQVALCATGESAWHQAAYGWLGATWTVTDGVGHGSRLPHPFLLGAVTLRPVPTLPETFGTVRDSWGRLADVPGRRATAGGAWMLRPSGQCVVPPVSGVSVVPTLDPLLFERTAFLSAGEQLPERPGELHPRGSERTSGLHLLIGWERDQPIGSALALAHDSGVVVSAVGVAARARRRGVGALLTAAAVNCAPDRPATLHATPVGERMYASLGFALVGRSLDWV